MTTSRFSRRFNGHELYGMAPGLLSDIATHPPFMDGTELCAQADPDTWFPEKGGSARQAKQICASCPLRQPCLEYALANGEQFGIWGGSSLREREAMPGFKPAPPAPREPAKAPVAPALPVCHRRNRYTSEAAARAAQRRMSPGMSHAANHTRPVPCSECDGWHITTRSAA